jgi:multiple sugar transport system permease protein
LAIGKFLLPEEKKVLISQKKSIQEAVVGYLLILPVIIVIAMLVIYPMFTSIYTSFTNKRLGVPMPKFIGLENYAQILKNAVFVHSLRNSIVWTLASGFLQFVLGMSLALMLNQSFKGRFFFRGLFIVPWVTPGVVIAITYRWLLNGMVGIVNQLMVTMHIIPESAGWFSDPMLVMPVLIYINVWRGIPFMMITLLAGLQTIPIELTEAAKVDGAGVIRRFFFITMPYMRHVIFIGLLIFTLWNFNNFDMIYLTTRGGPGTFSFTLPIMIYSAAFEEIAYGKAASISSLMFVFLLIIAMIYLQLMNKEGDE